MKDDIPEAARYAQKVIGRIKLERDFTTTALKLSMHSYSKDDIGEGAYNKYPTAPFEAIRDLFNRLEMLQDVYEQHCSRFAKDFPELMKDSMGFPTQYWGR